MIYYDTVPGYCSQGELFEQFSLYCSTNVCTDEKMRNNFIIFNNNIKKYFNNIIIHISYNILFEPRHGLFDMKALKLFAAVLRLYDDWSGARI